DGEHIHVGRVSIEDAIRALNHDAIHGCPMVIGLQWLALNRKHLAELLRQAIRFTAVISFPAASISRYSALVHRISAYRPKRTFAVVGLWPRSARLPPRRIG